MLRTGVPPLDDRLGGLRPGGVYLISGPPGAGKLALTLSFLAEGVRRGERVALVSGSPPGDILALARHFGFPLEEAWRSDRLVLVGFRGDYPRRLVHAGDPSEAFAELGSVLAGGVSRLGVDPGTLLWESRAGTETGDTFLEWCAAAGLTVMGTVVGDLTDGISPGTEWVLGRAAGALQLAVLPSGLRELRILRLQPPVDRPEPVTLEFSQGSGIVAPTGRLDRRRTDTPTAAGRRLVLLALSPVPADLLGWSRAEFEMTDTDDPLRLVSLLQSSPAAGVVLVYLSRAQTDGAIEVCRAVRPLTRAALLLVADEEVRAADRARALEAGADDFVSGDVDVRELATRIRRAVSTGRARPPTRGDPEPAATAPAPIPEILAGAEFATEVRRRLASPSHRLFTLVVFTARATPAERLGAVLATHLRTEAGDFGGRLTDGCAAVLQGARARQAEAFIGRVTGSLAAAGAAADVVATEVLTSPGDAGRIEARLAR